MFGIGSKNMSSSMIPMYLFLCILIANQFVFIHSLVFIHHDQDQNLLENARKNAIRRLVAQSFNGLDDSSSSSADKDLQLFIEPTVQRRFCCMSPLSGRKRFIRDLARQQQQVSDIVNQ